MTTDSPLHFPDPPQRIHLIGIKGMGMAGLAELLVHQGYRVTGSDTSGEFPSDRPLQKLGVPVADEFSAGHITDDIAAVVYSTVYGETNVERLAAADRQIPSWSYPEVAGLMMAAHDVGIAVAGSHGKTTTTAMLAAILDAAGFDPTTIVGAPVVAWQTSARLGSGQTFLMEADEYQNKLQFYKPRFVLITNIDYDHPDYFPDREAYEAVFLDFVRQLPSDGELVVWGGDPLVGHLRQATTAAVTTYGLDGTSAWRGSDIAFREGSTMFRVETRDGEYGSFAVPFPGEHYALNALGAITLAARLGVRADAAERALKMYRGTARRLEHTGMYRGALILDDYAHHPTEIAATIAGLRQGYTGRKLIVVFQPHTFSRTAAFLDAFGQALAEADRVFLLPIYGSQREADGSVTTFDLDAAVKQHGQSAVTVVPSLASAVDLLRREVGASDLVVTMGAGDVWQIGRQLAREP